MGVRWCDRCAARLDGPPLRRVVGGLVAYSGADYRDEVQAAIVTWKDHGRADLTPVLARVLARMVREAGLDAVRSGRLVLVPAPSSARSVRARGRAPVTELALGCARLLRHRGVLVRAVPALRHRQRVLDQAGLGATLRWANLDGAIAVVPAWGERLAGAEVVLVDDVITTGATVSECARALACAGAPPVAIVTVAATSLHSAPGHRVIDVAAGHDTRGCRSEPGRRRPD
jgi:predicted amidophosphoribosyltransferase